MYVSWLLCLPICGKGLGLAELCHWSDMMGGALFWATGQPGAGSVVRLRAGGGPLEDTGGSRRGELPHPQPERAAAGRTGRRSLPAAILHAGSECAHGERLAGAHGRALA